MQNPDIPVQILRQLGSSLDPALLKQVQELFLPLHETEPYSGVRVTRDVAYGPDDRHRLDIFVPGELPKEAPVFVFVHGGGFVGGNKKQPGLPYNDNIALWGVRHGLLAVNITYRLAPAHPWPAVVEDLGLAVQWLRDGIAAHCGDPVRIYLFGTSAGAAHTAGWLANADAEDTAKVAGAILLSGVFDLELDSLSPNLRAYFGEEPALYRERSSIHGLVESGVPLLIAFAEMDPPFFQRQALALAEAFLKRHGRTPRLVRLDGHNHFSGTASLNAAESELGRQIGLFIG